MSQERKSLIPCIFDPNLTCGCELKQGNVRFINNLGNKARGLRAAIQREGYDTVSPGLIRELLVNPNGSYYTEGLDQRLQFSPEMRDIREKIIQSWKATIMRVSNYDPNSVLCPNFKKDLMKSKE